MSKLQNNFTTPEQSKRLLEMGVPADSADCIASIVSDPEWYNNEFAKGDIRISVLHPRHKYTKIAYPDDGSRPIDEPYPCWSVGRLIEIFETCTSTKFERWSHRGVIRPLLEDCIEHIEFALNPDTIMEMDFSKLEE